jgi:hypothetical protein
MTDEDRRYVRDAFDHWIRSGYCDEDLLGEIEERAQDLVEGDLPAAFLQELRTAVEAGLAAQRAREAGWTGQTLNDRLEEAFAELTDSGIVALEDAGYTASDGWDDCREAADDLDEPRGAVFFHGQDVERGVRGEGLLLAFGALGRGEDPDEASAAIGREVCEVLGKYGVPTAWSGAATDRIAIPPFPWQKRAFTEAPSE